MFSGFARTDYGIPVPYPVANHPQAWAARSVPHGIPILFGLDESIDVEVLRDEGAIDVGVDRGAELTI